MISFYFLSDLGDSELNSSTHILEQLQMFFLASYLSTIVLIYIAIIDLIQFSSSVLCLPGDKPP